MAARDRQDPPTPESGRVEGARPAMRGDLADCARLLEEARSRAFELRGGPEYLQSLQPGCRLPAPSDPIDEAWVKAQWTGTDRVLLVGTIDDTVVGVGAGRIVPQGLAQVGRVDCCYVESDARGIGVGTALAELLVSRFVAAGCVGVDALALPGDRATKQLFESQGLSARLLILRRPLP
jgi:GNAT superfamily N-acetyltransferase